MIRVGVDAWNLPGDHRGIGRYVRAILEVWLTAFADRVRVTLVIPERLSIIAAPRYRREIGGRPLRVRSRTSATPRAVDALWFPFNGPSWSGWRVPSIATLHDASTFVFPEFDERARATFRRAATACERIITDSAFSAAELVREVGVEPARIVAIPLGVAPPLPSTRTAIDPQAFGRFVLVVSGTEPRKGLPTVIEAMRRVQAHHPDIGLVHIGPPTFGFPAHDGVRATTLGVVDDETLAAFYRACAVFVYASTYEGFGLPILEAMSYGAPVVAAASSALPEAGGDAALYAAPGDADHFADAILRMLGEALLRADLTGRGYARAAEMTWARTAERTLEEFERLLPAR